MSDIKNIVFMGTPAFAVESLKHLLNSGIAVKAVVTIPDKPAGRGLKLIPSAVKEFAVENNLPVLQPEKLKDEAFIAELKKINADLFVVVAFRMLPEIVWSMPKHGTINLHGSLLPQYRGAAPINWAVINGDTKTGATTFFIEKEIDTGKIIDSVEIPISHTDTAGTIHDTMMVKGAELLTKTVNQIFDETVKAKEQNEFYGNENELKPAPKIFKPTCKIDWTENGAKIYNLIRGLSPYPTAYADYFDEKNECLGIKIFEASFTEEKHNHVPGYIVTDHKTYLHIYCKDGFVNILNLQLPGKKRMKIDELLRGYKFKGERVALAR
jgi:methionyl-tRNA formyltransferase